MEVLSVEAPSWPSTQAFDRSFLHAAPATFIRGTRASTTKRSTVFGIDLSETSTAAAASDVDSVNDTTTR